MLANSGVISAINHSLGIVILTDNGSKSSFSVRLKYTYVPSIEFLWCDPSMSGRKAPLTKVSSLKSSEFHLYKPKERLCIE